LNHVDFLVECTEQVHGNDVDAGDFPLLECSKCKGDAICGEFGDGSICFEAIDAICLGEPPGNQARFESNDATVGVVLGFEYPFARNEVLPGGILTSSNVPFFIKESYSS
jgi:hypothetical protein